jgi:hypothetical protein
MDDTLAREVHGQRHTGDQSMLVVLQTECLLEICTPDGLNFLADVCRQHGGDFSSRVHALRRPRTWSANY